MNDHWCRLNQDSVRVGWSSGCQCGWSSSWFPISMEATEAGLGHTTAAGDMTNAPPTTRFATCSYIEFQPEYGIPVRATLGAPRFKLKYPLRINLQQAAPDRAWFSAPEAEFDRRYFQKLDRIGVDFYREFSEKMSDGRALVLLCFERLDKSRCHRTLFADWWRGSSGEQVPELGAQPSRPLDAAE